jgi:divalent metal cation (Fe/Co/Zn/Cd) transporter
MDNFALVASTLLPFIVAIGVLHRTLFLLLERGKLPPTVAAALMWIAVLGMPKVIAWCVVPMWFNLYTAHPYLQSAAWDVRIATMTYIGMVVAVVSGVFGASYATWQYFSYGR